MAAIPERRILGFHPDSEGQWVAELECGHTQHVRHEPPWQVRPWVVTEEGRAGRLGSLLPCRLCAEVNRPALPAEELSERAALAGLLIPVALMLLLWALSDLGRDGSSSPIALSDAVLLPGIAVELLMMATIGWWLWRRGWRPHRTATLPLHQLDVVRGLALWVGAIVAVGIWATLCRALLPNLFAVAKHTQIVGAPRFWVSVSYSAVNAVFEELLWLGLGFAAFRRLGATVSAAISVALRLAAHAYQGPLALVTVLPVGIIFTLYYVRTRRLWPVVVAHAFQDTLALSILATRASTGLG